MPALGCVARGLGGGRGKRGVSKCTLYGVEREQGWANRINTQYQPEHIDAAQLAP